MTEANHQTDGPRPPYLSIRPLWDDPDLIEMEVRIVTDDGWAGTARAYAACLTLPREARSLELWSRRPEGETTVEFGMVTGSGWVQLRFYLADMAGHVACEVQLATKGYADRRLAVVLRTEPGLVERFARHLVSVAESLQGEAVMQCV